MAKINTFLEKLLPLLKSHAVENSNGVQRIGSGSGEEILSEVEAPNNQVPEEEDLGAVILRFDEMMENNPINYLLEIMARKRELEARQRRRSNGDEQEV